MKKSLLVSFFVLTFFVVAPHVVAQGFVPLAPIPGLTDPTSATSVINSNNLASFFNNLYKYLIGVAAVLAIIEIIWGGLEISTQDSVSKKQNGKERITQAILGLILVLSPVLVFSIINPSILNLYLNLQPINTSPIVGGSGPGSIGASPQTITNPNTGQTTVIFNEGWTNGPVPGATCFVTAGQYYCASNATNCNIASNGATSVTSPCTGY